MEGDRGQKAESAGRKQQMLIMKCYIGFCNPTRMKWSPKKNKKKQRLYVCIPSRNPFFET